MNTLTFYRRNALTRTTKFSTKCPKEEIITILKISLGLCSIGVTSVIVISNESTEQERIREYKQRRIQENEIQRHAERDSYIKELINKE